MVLLNCLNSVREEFNHGLFDSWEPKIAEGLRKPNKVTQLSEASGKSVLGMEVSLQSRSPVLCPPSS